MILEAVPASNLCHSLSLVHAPFQTTQRVRTNLNTSCFLEKARSHVQLIKIEGAYVHPMIFKRKPCSRTDKTDVKIHS